MTDPDKRYCGGKKRQGEGTCTRPPGWGTAHAGAGRCKLHGGSAPSGRVAGATELARRAMETYGVKVDTNPIEALLDEVRWTAGHVAWLRERVQQTEQDALVWGQTEAVNKQASEYPGLDTTEAAKPNVWLVLYQQERKHLVDVCKAAISAGIAERQVQLAEEQGRMLADVIRAVLGDLGLTAEQRARAEVVVPQRLRAVA